MPGLREKEEKGEEKMKNFLFCSLVLYGLIIQQTKQKFCDMIT